MVKPARKTFTLVAAVLFSLVWIALLLLPAVKRVEGSGEEYLCIWEDGTRTNESFASAYGCFTESDGAHIFLSRGGIAGELAVTSDFGTYYDVLRTGTSRDVIALDPSVLSGLERVALWRSFGERVWWNGEELTVWTETGAVVKKSARCKELIAESGSLTAGVLKNSHATILELRGGASFSAQSLAGTEVKALRGVSPYFTQDGALYLNTAGGLRLTACEPDTVTLAATDCDFADEGALAVCNRLESLTVPFAGTSRDTAVEEYRPELASLFLLGEEYHIPSSLRSVTVTGGEIAADAFYGMADLEEIVLCGVRAENISRNAFSGCKSLRRLHTPFAGVELGGGFIAHRLECGCTLFVRELS